MKQSIFSYLLLLLLLSVRFERVVSCGGFFCFPQTPILQAGETIAFGVSTSADGFNKDVTMVVQINYEGPSPDFSWILPVMFEPSRISVGSDVMFDVLFEQSRPTFRLTIQDYWEATTCEDTDLNVPCPIAATMEDVGFGGGSTATVLQEDTVGPYEYVLLEPSEVDPGLSVFTWLDDNGYDQPLESFGLIDYYARQDQLFLALRLRKGSNTGDIRPIVLDYTLPGEMANVACVPIQLTSIAATPDMPIQVYVFSDDDHLQAFPVNYFTVELDDARANWLGCQDSPNCYLNDMRDRFKTFLEEEGIRGHAFVTEYAGASSIIGENSIAIDVNLTALENAATPSEFLDLLTDAAVPGNNDLVNTILGRYISNEYDENTFFLCVENPSVYQPEYGPRCHAALLQETIENISSLVQELNEALFLPTREAQNFVNQFSYMTRFYGQLGPQNMDKDPFFAFNRMLPDVSNVHEATAVPLCSDGSAEGLRITVDGDNTTTFFQPADFSCGSWFATGDPTFSNDTLGVLDSVSMATRLAATGYEGEDGMTVFRSSDTGFFPPDVVSDIVSFMDLRVPDQTVPPYNGTFPITGGTTTVTATDDNDDNNTTDTSGSDMVEPAGEVYFGSMRPTETQVTTKEPPGGPTALSTSPPPTDSPTATPTGLSSAPPTTSVPTTTTINTEEEESSSLGVQPGEEGVTVDVTPLTNAPVVSSTSSAWKCSMIPASIVSLAVVTFLFCSSFT